MRHIVIDQKSNDTPQPAVAIVHTNKPTPISLKGLYLQRREITGHKGKLETHYNIQPPLQYILVTSLLYCFYLYSLPSKM